MKFAHCLLKYNGNLCAKGLTIAHKQGYRQTKGAGAAVFAR